ALAVEIHGIRGARERVLIMERNLAFEADPDKFRQHWLQKEIEISQQIEKARNLLEKVTYTSRDLLSIASLTASMNVDGHRADLVILKTARAHAAFEGRTAVNERDILLASELALPHRIKRGPFQQGEVDIDDLQERIDQIQSAVTNAGEPEPIPEEENHSGKKKGLSQESQEEDSSHGPMEPTPQDIFSSGDARWWEGGEKVKGSPKFAPRKLDTPLDRLTRKQAGRRSQTRTDRKRGRYIQARSAQGKTTDLAFDATLRAAAPYQKQRQDLRKRVAFAIRPDDFQRKIRVKRTANLVLFVVDASWSMAVAERMAATKGAILSLLTDAYQRRDRVGLVVFQKDRAALVLPPTNSVELARRALVDIPVGGKTPLSAGLYLAHQVLQREKILHTDVLPLMIILTDGAGNVSMSGMAPQEESHQIAEKIAEDAIRTVVINMEHAAFDQGLANDLAYHLKAPCYTLHELKAENLYRAVREEMAS
ncbi:MAG: VWA domain-containing protein, partial [Anaerolineales bacterium]